MNVRPVQLFSAGEVKHNQAADKTMFKVINKNTRLTLSICSKLFMKTSEPTYWHRFISLLLARFI